MAVDIDLEIYKNTSDTERKEVIHLYFGKALHSTSRAGCEWVKNNGMTIDPPWSLDDKNKKRGEIIPKKTLLEWVRQGYLSSDFWGNDTSGDFLEKYSDDAVFRLSFLDWS